MKLSKLIDRFLPEKLKKDQIVHSRSRITMGIIILSIALMALLIFSLIVFKVIPSRRWGRSPFILLGQLLFYVSLFFLVNKASLIKLTGNLFIFSNFSLIMTGYILFNTHPVISSVLYILPAIAILSFTLMGMKEGILWTVVFSIAHIFLISMKSPEDIFDYISTVVIIIAAYGIIIIAGSVYEYITFNLMIQLNFERDLYRDKAHTDKLTNIANRFQFDKFLDMAIIKAQHSDESFALAYIDLNGFKPINDKYGHNAGDKVLITIASRMENTIRNNDLVARLGGDEFGIIFQNLHELSGTSIAVKHVSRAIEQAIPLEDGLEISVSGSFGVVLYSREIGDRESLVEIADREMYSAKKSGKNISFYNRNSDDELE